ncbi:hypothetical protein [Chitinilyticum litopenaei]|uniref:hypothetical protein n=1 Tax=Chitinilyticum litopenaei TaxID=1121276 RepID=UPI001185F8AA|nr:hypothetical protein [Chitinilyticum litopenaei]
MLHDLTGENRWQWPCSHQQLPPQLQSLLPPQDPYSPMRRLMHNLLDARGIERRARMPIEQEWLLRTQFGAGGIGHLDVFADDHSAARHYVQPQPILQALPPADAIWSCLRNGKVNPGPDELCSIMANMQLIGVPGMIPKLIHERTCHRTTGAYHGGTERLSTRVGCRTGNNTPNWPHKKSRSKPRRKMKTRNGRNNGKKPSQTWTTTAALMKKAGSTPTTIPMTNSEHTSPARLHQ